MKQSFLILAFVLTCSLSFAVEKEPVVILMAAEGSQGDPQPIVVIEPEYPAAAIENQVEGQVTVAYQVNESGRASNIEVLDAEPANLFERVVTNALQNSTFVPADVSDTRTFRLNAFFVLREPIAEPWKSNPDAPPAAANEVDEIVELLVRVDPEYPADAMAEQLSGSVRVAFTVGADGTVQNPVVVESEPSDVFNQAAIDAVLQWRFRPALQDGQRVPLRAVQLIEFEAEIEEPTETTPP
ncbi:MAG: TonB family protein [Pseudomonadota bacterium]